MRRLLVAALLLRSAAGLSGEVIAWPVQTKAQGIPEFTLLLRLPESRPVKGVMCLSVLGGSVEEVKSRISGEDTVVYKPFVDWAFAHDYALIAWGSRTIWDPHRNWNELEKKTFRTQDARFDALATAWDRGVQALARKYELPTSGYLMHGISGAGQFALRLAMRKPDRFWAVHAHVASSFDEPSTIGKSVVWCVTTGENEAGYARSRAFFAAATAKGYPLVYKAYPGLAHTGSPSADRLALACFDFAVAEGEKAREAAKGKDAKPDWQKTFSAAPYVADIVNQLVARRENEERLPPEFRQPLPTGELVNAWRKE